MSNTSLNEGELSMYTELSTVNNIDYLTISPYTPFNERYGARIRMLTAFTAALLEVPGYSISESSSGDNPDKKHRFISSTPLWKHRSSHPIAKRRNHCLVL